MRAAVEISMYPLTGDYLPPIQAFIDRLNTHPELVVRTNSLATQVWGALDRGDGDPDRGDGSPAAPARRNWYSS
jgi:hypothetical protein